MGFKSEDRPLSTKERLAFAATLLLIIGTTATCGSCVDRFTVAYSSRGPKDQAAAAVQIRVTCGYPSPDIEKTGDPDADRIIELLTPEIQKVFMGSGVVVSSDRVLTNVHVVSCDEGHTVRVEVNTGDENWRPSTVEILMPERDVARIQLNKPLPFDVPRVVVGNRPEVGDRVCAATAVPIWGYRCGIVQPSGNVGEIMTDIVVQHGFSGSSVEDSDGHLIGLINAMIRCEYGIPCVGVVVPLSDIAWIADE